jgi:motility quorum-sensing regulator / GCU-specific mRNA interferase toxin
MEHFGRSHYDLEEIKALLRNERTRVVTRNAFRTAAAVGFISEEDIVRRCLSLNRGEIYKTMTSHWDHTVWQDVYKTAEGDFVLYIKLQVDTRSNGVVISFKRADE